MSAIVTKSSNFLRRFILHRQGLIGKGVFSAGKKGVLQVLERLGYVQIDTISVIMRAHHHVLWTRVPGYQPRHLENLLAERKAFEYWSHAAAFLPARDFRYSWWRKGQVKRGEGRWFETDPKLSQWLLEHIRTEGPRSSRDFEADPMHKSGPWWGWKPAKQALEMLFHEGELMIDKRINFQKVYNLSERVVADQGKEPILTAEEMARHLIRSTIQAQGLASAEEMSYLRRGIKPTIKQELKKLHQSGELVQVTVKQDPGYEAYALTEEIDSFSGRLGKAQLHILSPFDNLVIQRKRMQRFFDFDYQIECYVPGPKRKFGYFTLPILFGDRFIGRLDSKADRKKKVYILKNLVMEEGFEADENVVAQLIDKIQSFAEANGCESIQVEKGHPEAFMEKIKARI